MQADALASSAGARIAVGQLDLQLGKKKKKNLEMDTHEDKLETYEDD